MNWFLLALISSVSSAFIALLLKVGTRKVSTGLLALAVSVGSAFFSGLLVSVDGFSLPTNGVVLAALSSASIDCLATLLYLSLLSCQDLSLLITLTAFTPVFVVGLESLFLGHFVTSIGFIGVLMISIGSYVIVKKSSELKILSDDKASYKALVLMIFVTFLWSLTTIISKYGVGEIGGVQWAFARSSFLSLMLLIYLVVKREHIFEELKNRKSLLMLICAVSFLGDISMLVALDKGLSSYVMAIKKSSMLLTVILAIFLLKEAWNWNKMLGSLIVLVGLIVLANV